MNTGKTTNHAASVAYRASDYLTAGDLPGYLVEVISDGDTRALPLALREAADVLGMAELARRTGLSREALYRTLSSKGNPRLDTLNAILDAFGLRLAVSKKAARPSKKTGRRSVEKVAAKKPSAASARKRA